jgi:FdhE protein
MSAAGAPQDPAGPGQQAAPPYAVLPGPATLFLARSRRLRALASNHPLKPYLSFVAGLTEAQHNMQPGLPPALLPEAAQIQQAIPDGLPPLARACLEPGEAAEATMRRFLESLCETPVPGWEGTAALQALAGTSSETMRQLMGAALKEAPVEDIAERVLVLAGLQVHLSRLAAQLPAGELKPAGDGACPVCGSPPMTSAVVGWPSAQNSRYCTCPLCATMWNVVRIKCTLCGSTEGIGYHVIEGQPESVKAETCDKCGHYVKVLYQVKDPALDPLADDIATLDLDMLLAGEGWKRGGQNPFLLGY